MSEKVFVIAKKFSGHVEMQINTMSYHRMPIRMIITKTTRDKC